MEFTEQIKRAYKKMKASVYYDKTQVVLRNQIVKYEANGILEMEDDFSNISEMLNASEEEWHKFEVGILDSIKALTFPKKLKKLDDSIIINYSCDDIVIDDDGGEQHFIKMDIQGHLLGILWVMYIGKFIDEDLYECSYGNRLSEKLFSDEKGLPKFSNSLFKPYFTQYENWRDYGLEKAQEHLKLSKDAIILTMDFRRFFYSVNFEEKDFEKYYESYCEKTNNGDNYEEYQLIDRINKFVFKVLEKYSSLFRNTYENRIFLPIGFFPSNILSNSYLSIFDSTISTRWNPLYYGRYVDDIIIVDKVEKNSKLFELLSNKTVLQNEILEYFLCKCNADKNNECPRESYLLHNDKDTYLVNNKFLNNENGKIEVQNGKVKVFYFKHNHSDALITKFKKEIALNKSEFRYMPEDSNMLEAGDYSEIYELDCSASINKLSGVTGVTVDKYALSKFLGKYVRVGGIINDSRESMFIQDILKIFDERVIIENYTLWEKVIEILIVNDKFDVLNNFIELILKSITNLKYKRKRKTIPMESSLLEVLYGGICKSFALNWGKKSKECIQNICKAVDKLHIKNTKNIVQKYSYEKILEFRHGYYETRMVDKNVMPTMIDLIIESKDFESFTDENEVNLSTYQQFINCIRNFKYEYVDYYYYPYTITPQELQMGSIIYDIKASEDLKNPKEMVTLINKFYHKFNYTPHVIDSCNQIMEIDSKKIIETNNFTGFGVRINNKLNFNNDKMKLALANVKIEEKDFMDVLTNVPRRNYERYKLLAAIVKEAIKNRADMLVFPESYLPIEWLPIVMSISAKTNMGIITGIEHVVSQNEVYNLTATILPYQHEDCKYAFLNIHSKAVFSPDEKFIIEGYRYKCHEGKTHELLIWNNIWLSTYCCYEMASIRNRAIFQSIADLIVTIEWNHDINYYSNIIESLSRDLHCYCVQVNTADYGDSRIIKPSKTENKDIVKIKGGINGTAIIDEINIKALRDFQIKEYGLQKMDKTFKPTPPFFSHEIVNKKRKGTLWNSIEEELKKYYNTYY